MEIWDTLIVLSNDFAGASEILLAHLKIWLARFLQSRASKRPATTSQRSYQAIWREKKGSSLQTLRNNPPNNYIKMERRNDGNFLIARQISSPLRAKIAQGLITP